MNSIFNRKNCPRVDYDCNFCLGDWWFAAFGIGNHWGVYWQNLYGDKGKAKIYRGNLSEPIIACI